MTVSTFNAERYAESMKLADEKLKKLNFDVVEDNSFDMEGYANDIVRSYMQFLFNEGKVMATTTDILNVRKGPSTLTEIVATYNKGAEIELLEYLPDVNFYRTDKGYIYAEYVKID